MGATPTSANSHRRCVGTELQTYDHDDRDDAVRCRDCERPIKAKIVARARRNQNPTPTHCFGCWARRRGKATPRERKVEAARAKRRASEPAAKRRASGPAVSDPP